MCWRCRPTSSSCSTPSALDVAVLLNITPDHLDRHGDMAGYVAAKRDIFARQQPGDCAVIGVDDQPSRAVYERAAARPGIAAIAGRARRRPSRAACRSAPACWSTPTAIRSTSPTCRPCRASTTRRTPPAPGPPAAALGVPRETIVRGPQELPRPAAPPGARRLGRRRRLRQRQQGDQRRRHGRALCRAIATSTGSLGGLAKEGGVAPLAPWFDRIRHAFLIGEATELFAGQLEGKLAYSRCGDLKSALDAAHARAQREARRQRAVVLLSPACASLDQLAELRASRRCVPRHGARPAGGQSLGRAALIQVPRDDRSVIGRWWWTVDRWTLGAVLAIMAFGVLLILAASPPVAERIGADSFLFAKRQFVFLPMALMLMLAISLPRRATSGGWRWSVFCGSVRAARRHLGHRRRDQGRAALDLRARPVEPAAFRVRQALPRRDLGLAAGAEPRRAAGAGLLPVDPAGRRRAGAARAAARPRHERRGRPGLGRPALRRRPADVGRGLRRAGRRGRRWSAPTSCSATCAAAFDRFLDPVVGRQLPGQHLARGLHERRPVRPRPGRGHGEGAACPTRMPISSWPSPARSSA